MSSTVITIRAIHQEVSFPVSAQRVYEALTDSRRFAEWSGAPAEIGNGAGDAFSCFGGMISGRHIELLPRRRIVQAWRVANWEEGIYSIARFELTASGEAETQLVFDHTGFPPEHGGHLASGWREMYWDKLRAYLEQAG
ncbi:MAG: SRPBCC domain-containing protein [Pseudomonadota bacterium]